MGEAGGERDLTQVWQEIENAVEQAGHCLTKVGTAARTLSSAETLPCAAYARAGLRSSMTFYAPPAAYPEFGPRPRAALYVAGARK